MSIAKCNNFTPKHPSLGLTYPQFFDKTPLKAYRGRFYVEKNIYTKGKERNKPRIFGKTKNMNTTSREISDAEAFEVAAAYRRYDDALRRLYQEAPPISAEAKNIVWEGLMNEARMRITHDMKKSQVFAAFPFHLLPTIILLALVHSRPAHHFEGAIGRPPYIDGKLAESDIGGEFLDAHDL